MTGIKELINALDENDLRVQFMTHGDCELTIRGESSQQYLSAKFKSSPENMGKQAIIIWVDNEKLKTAARVLSNPTLSPHPQTGDAKPIDGII